MACSAKALEPRVSPHIFSRKCPNWDRTCFGGNNSAKPGRDYEVGGQCKSWRDGLYSALFIGCQNIRPTYLCPKGGGLAWHSRFLWLSSLKGGRWCGSLTREESGSGLTGWKGGRLHITFLFSVVPLKLSGPGKIWWGKLATYFGKISLQKLRLCFNRSIHYWVNMSYT